MTKEDELQALREENRLLKALVAELLPLKEQLEEARARIKELEERLARAVSRPPLMGWGVCPTVLVVRAESVREVRQDMLGTPSRWWSSQMRWCVTVRRSVVSARQTSYHFAT